MQLRSSQDQQLLERTAGVHADDGLAALAAGGVLEVQAYICRCAWGDRDQLIERQAPVVERVRHQCDLFKAELWAHSGVPRFAG